MESVTKLFVATTGCDNATGTLEAPLKTIRAATKKCRELVNAGVAENGVEICIRQGDYSESISLSGMWEVPITYTAYNNESVRIIGGKKLNAFRKVTDAAVLQRLSPDIADKVYEISFADCGITEVPANIAWDFSTIPSTAELRILKNGEFMLPASYPNNGQYIPIDEVISQPVYAYNGMVLDYNQTEPIVIRCNYEGLKKWRDLDDVWIYGYPAFDWSNHFHKIEVEKDTGVITLQQPFPYSVQAGKRIRFVNILEELDCENEFFVDKKAEKIYIISNNPKEDSFEIASQDAHLAEVRDAKNITFRNLTFALCRKAAIVIENCENVNVIGCTVRDNLSSGITLKNSFRCEIADNHITNLGASAIIVNCGICETCVPSEVKIINNNIHGFARIQEMYQEGIKIYGFGNYVAHNEIYDTIHTAVYFYGNRNVFEYNDIHDCLKKTADAGLVYCGRSWLCSGNVFRYNYFHDCPDSTGKATTKGIYLDDLMLGTEIYSNIFEGLQSGVYSHGGRKAVVKNNIFINCRKHSIRFFPCDYIAIPGFVQNTYIEPAKKWITEHPIWAEEFPEAQETVDDMLCMFPLYNTAEGNIVFNSPEIMVESQAYYTAINRNNLRTEDETIFADYANKNYAIRDLDSVRAIIPDFNAPPFERIGLIKR